MKYKKFFCALTAAAVALGSLGAAAPAGLSAFAAEKEPDMTFDGQHELDDTLSESDWDFSGLTDSSDDEEKYEKKVKAAFGSDLNKLTYRTLSRRTSLDLSGCGLTELPVDVIKYMPNLTSINLSDNYLENEDVRALYADSLSKLRSINLSRNYLTAIPSWVVSSSASTKNLSENFITGFEPRTIKTTVDTYYFSDGDPLGVDDYGNAISIEDFEDKIRSTVRFGDNSEIPEFILTDDEGESRITVDLEAFKSKAGLTDDGDALIVYTSADSIVVDIPVELAGLAETNVQAYLMNGTDLSSVKMLLNALIDEFSKLTKADYTETSWNNYEGSKKLAEVIKASGTSDFDIYKNAFDNLNRARKALAEVASQPLTKVIDEYVNNAKNYKAENYTTSSYSAFQTALDDLNALKKDYKNITAKEAESAIKRMQNAIAGLVGTSVNVPRTIPKSEFERVYGTSSRVERTGGSTRDGIRYSWSFTGTDVTAPADFNPEIKDGEAAVAENVLIEAGSLDSFFLFSTAQTAAFPGTGTLSVSFAKDMPVGKVYIYKWDTSAKRGLLQGETTLSAVTDSNVYTRTANIPVSDSGTYYISPKLNTFDLVSDEYTVDNTAKTIKLPVALSRTAAQFRAQMQNGKYLTILRENGTTVPDSAVMLNGMTVNSPNGEKYTVYVMGDVTNDGRADIDDALEILITFLAERKTEPVTKYGDVNSDGVADIDDSTVILLSYLKSV